jgi:hypothetical protein
MKYLLSLVALIVALAIPSPAQASSMLGMINGARSAPLENHSALAAAASAHAAQMAAEGHVFPSSNLGSITSDWEAMAENVGVGTDIAQVFDAFMASSPHRANITGDYTHAGVGTYTDDQGLVWVTVIFMRTAGSEAVDGTSPMVTTSEPTPRVAQSDTSRERPRRVAAALPEPRYGHDGLLPIAI